MSEFLKKLKKAADEGDAENAKSYVDLFNKIDEAADSVVDGTKLNESTSEDDIEPLLEEDFDLDFIEENKKIAEMEARQKEEEAELAIIAEIKNAQKDLFNLTVEREEAIKNVNETYELVITKQTELVNKLNSQYEEKYGKSLED